MKFREGNYEKWVQDKRKCKNSFESFAMKGMISGTDDPKTWSKRHIEKANHNLDFATFVIGSHPTTIRDKYPNQTFYDWATIACYYAIYHSSLALLSNSGYKSKSHMATLCGIILHYYHKDLIEEKHIKSLKNMEKENIYQFIEAQGLRERASYGVSVSFEERLSAMAKKDAIDFVEKAKEILKL